MSDPFDGYDYGYGDGDYGINYVEGEGFGFGEGYGHSDGWSGHGFGDSSSFGDGYGVGSDDGDGYSEGYGDSDGKGGGYGESDGEGVTIGEATATERVMTGHCTPRDCTCASHVPDLSHPHVVHINMLRGTIAKPTLEQIVHIYGSDALQDYLSARAERRGMSMRDRMIVYLLYAFIAAIVILFFAACHADAGVKCSPSGAGTMGRCE